MQKMELIEIDSDLQDLIPQFLTNRKNDMNQLLQFVETNDLAAIAALAHKIKGTAAGYGFSQLSEYASQLEQIAKGTSTGDLKTVATNMKNHFDRIEVRFISMS